MNHVPPDYRELFAAGVPADISDDKLYDFTLRRLHTVAYPLIYARMLEMFQHNRWPFPPATQLVETALHATCQWGRNQPPAFWNQWQKDTKRSPLDPNYSWLRLYESNTLLTPSLPAARVEFVHGSLKRVDIVPIRHIRQAALAATALNNCLANHFEKYFSFMLRETHVVTVSPCTSAYPMPLASPAPTNHVGTLIETGTPFTLAEISPSGKHRHPWETSQHEGPNNIKAIPHDADLALRTYYHYLKRQKCRPTPDFPALRQQCVTDILGNLPPLPSHAQPLGFLPTEETLHHFRSYLLTFCPLDIKTTSRYPNSAVAGFGFDTSIHNAMAE